MVFDDGCIMRNENMVLEELVHLELVAILITRDGDEFAMNASALDLYSPNSAIVSHLGKFILSRGISN